MSKTQDVFGASPKSVLNKPMMHVQQSYPSGTAAPAHTVGQNVRALNTVKTNEIIGAALSSSQVALPAGEYFIDGECHIASNQVANATVQTQLQKADKTVLLSGSVANQSTNTNVAGTATSRVTGRITLTETTALELNGHGITSSSGLQYNVGNTGQPEIGADLRIWKLDSNVETPVIADPSMTLARPMMHVQDQKPQGTAGGTSVAGLNDRVLNTVLTNEIPGASLASNEVTLPAGEYFIAAYMNAHFTSTLATSAQGLLRKSDDTVILFGPGVGAYNVTQEGWHRLSGRFTLTESTAVKLTTDCKGAYAEYGLGNPSNLGQDEIYTDVQIWQLDAVNKQPILVNDRLYPLPGNVIVTGNMHGLDSLDNLQPVPDR